MNQSVPPRVPAARPAPGSVEEAKTTAAASRIVSGGAH